MTHLLDLTQIDRELEIVRRQTARANHGSQFTLSVNEERAWRLRDGFSFHGHVTRR